MTDLCDFPKNIILQGDALKVLRTLPSESVNCIITSPPYYRLRVYHTEPQIWGGQADCEHEFQKQHIPPKGRRNKPENLPNTGNDMATQEDDISPRFGSSYETCIKCGSWRGELGLEPTIELYIEHLMMVFRECKRVLRKDGCFFLNIGDSYAGSNCGSNDYRENGASISTNSKKYQGQKSGKTQDVPDKSLCLIPFHLALALQTDGWIIRNTIIWHKPNCMPSSADDRFTVNFEPIFFCVKSPRYWFEQQFESLNNPERRNFTAGGRTHGINKDRNDNDLGQRSKTFSILIYFGQFRRISP